jgi:hypothetical protein
MKALVQAETNRLEVRILHDVRTPTSVQACGLPLQGRQKLARTLHGQPLMIEAQRVQAA